MPHSSASPCSGPRRAPPVEPAIPPSSSSPERRLPSSHLPVRAPPLLVGVCHHHAVSSTFLAAQSVNELPHPGQVTAPSSFPPALPSRRPTIAPTELRPPVSRPSIYTTSPATSSTRSHLPSPPVDQMASIGATCRARAARPPGSLAFGPPSRPGQFGHWAKLAPHDVGPKLRPGTVPAGNLFSISFKY
jgi:hypothetical protein